MLKELLSGSRITDLPLLAMLFFIAAFAVVVVRSLSKKRGPDYAQMSRLPLEDQELKGDEVRK